MGSDPRPAAWPTAYIPVPGAALRMVTFKLVVSDPKSRKSEASEVKDAAAQLLMGRKVGDVVDATTIGLTGKIMITGGSDRAGFPMRRDTLGGGKNYVLMTRGVGYRSREDGVKKRKLVRGNTITEETYQVNAKRVE
jgi:small subunit ribosomal protein S6e